MAEKTYRFYGWEQAEATPINADYPGITDPRSLYDALTHVWCAETCASRMRERWSPENMTLGQCSITAVLVQDIFGGKIYGIHLEDGVSIHCYNVVEDRLFDLTSEQFGGEVLDYRNNPEMTREKIFRNPEKKERYELLKKELQHYLQHG